VTLTLIINADDLGYDPAVSRGIIESMERGVVSSTTAIVNGPHSQDALSKVKGSALAVGLHFNLSRFAPVSGVSKGHLGGDGGFVEDRARELPVAVVEQEAQAQLEKLEAMLGRPASHLDVHKHLHRHGNVLDGLVRVALKRKLPVRSVDDKMRKELRDKGVITQDLMLGDAGADAYWTRERFKMHLWALPESGTVELMCHPGYAPLTVKSGYSAQREIELKTFTSKEAGEWLDSRELRPTSWWSLHPAR
jgi:chitin disaccharide deacetylase